MNTAVTGVPSSFRVIHLDLPNKIFGGLFHMRDCADDSSGSDLSLFEFNGLPRIDPKHGFRVHPSAATNVKTIPYKKNTLIMFVNEINSLPGLNYRLICCRAKAI